MTALGKWYRDPNRRFKSLGVGPDSTVGSTIFEFIVALCAVTKANQGRR